MYNGVGKDNMGYYGLLWVTMGYYGLLWVAMGYYGLLWASDIINKNIVTHINSSELIGTHYRYQYKLMPQATINPQQKKTAPRRVLFSI